MTVVGIITVTLNILLQTSLDEFPVFKSGSVLPILGSILRFAYIIRLGNHFWGDFYDLWEIIMLNE